MPQRRFNLGPRVPSHVLTDTYGLAPTGGVTKNYRWLPVEPQRRSEVLLPSLSRVNRDPPSNTAVLVHCLCGTVAAREPLQLCHSFFRAPPDACDRRAIGSYTVPGDELTVRNAQCLAAEADSTIKQGTEAELWFESDHLHLFDPKSGRNL